MKPARQKTIQLLLFAGLIINLSSTCVFAIDEPSIDNAPVIGEFLYDEEMAAIIEEKEAEMFSAPQPYAISKLLPINQVAQERSNWCGYASIESILNYENIFKTQSQIAIAIRGANNMDSSCPWLWSNGDTMDQFPVPNYLNEQLNTGSFLYVPYPFGDAGATTLTANDVKTRVNNNNKQEPRSTSLRGFKRRNIRTS